MIRSELPFSFSEVCAPSPLPLSSQRGSWRKTTTKQKETDTASRTNNRQQMPFSLSFILIFSGIVKRYEAARETVEGMKKMTRFCAICLPSKRQYFSLKQFLGNLRWTNVGSLNRRQQRRRFFNTRAQRGWGRVKDWQQQQWQQLQQKLQQAFNTRSQRGWRQAKD